MKKYICIIGLLLAVVAGCKKADYLLYNDTARIQQADTNALNYTFIYEPAAVVRDTLYIRVNTIGGITPNNRAVKLVQVAEYDYTYVRDPVTNLITDTIATERPFKAIAGKHYVAFDDPSIASLMAVKANNAMDSLPIILLRDASLKDNTFRLRVRLEANDVFAAGENKAIERTIVFSDRLERFYSWRVDNGTAPAFYSFGKYSTGKHQFMYDVLKVNIDETWYQAIALVQAQTHYKNLVKDALADFNTNPANIASGKAPVRETSDPTSAVVFFP
jgi:hypothetical protein